MIRVYYTLTASMSSHSKKAEGGMEFQRGQRPDKLAGFWKLRHNFRGFL
jgi:hypothetical protein